MRLSERIPIRAENAGVRTPEELREWRKAEAKRNGTYAYADTQPTAEQKAAMTIEELWKVDPWAAHVREGGD